MSIPTYSGLEPLRIFPGSNFVNIGERTNVTSIGCVENAPFPLTPSR